MSFSIAFCSSICSRRGSLNVWNNNKNNDDYKGYDYLPLTSPAAASAEHN